MNDLVKRVGDRLSKHLKLVKYDTVFYKRFAIVPSIARSDSSLIDYVWENVFTKKDMIVDRKTMRVGNREGLSLMERMDRLEREINQLANESGMQKEQLLAQNIINEQTAKELRAQNIINEQAAKELRAQNIINEQTAKELRVHRRIWCSIRVAEIKRNANYETEEAKGARSERNQIIYGGDIVGDLLVLEFLKIEMPDEYDSTREAFETWYEVSLQYRDQIARAPELIIRTFDTLANTKSRKKWSRNRELQEKAQNLCRGIIRKWLGCVDAAGGEYPEDDIRREFEKLVSLK